MCELFAISSRRPTTVTFSLETLSRHGRADRPIGDGWGVGFYDGPDARVLREPSAIYESPWVKFIEQHGPKSNLVISHIRRVSTGSKRLADTHPFLRPLGGRMHMFAHNGNAEGIFDNPKLVPGDNRPIGGTDSEFAFCALLNRLRNLWSGSEPPSPSDRHAVVSAFAVDLQTLGPANFLYADSELLFVFSDRRRQSDGRFVPPGLHVLQRECEEPLGTIGGDGVAVESEAQTILLIASVPLTDEPWRPLYEGELMMIRNGNIVAA